MPYDPSRHHRRSIRLQEYDYSQAGAYFVTLVTYQRMNIFGTIEDGTMLLNNLGKHISRCWLNLQQRFSGIVLDEFIVMPNHLHGVIFLQEQREALGKIVGAFKSVCVHELITLSRAGEMNASPGKLWQRNYYEHIVRNDQDLNAIREYIQNNPLQWDLDQENVRKQH